MEQKINLEEKLVGLKTEHRTMSYTWRDLALYALAVGAKETELQYTYENGMKALPTYGVIPYFGVINVFPRIHLPDPASFAIHQYIPGQSRLHMEHELIMFRPIDPIKGTFVYQDVITNVYDRGPDKGAVVKTTLDVHDEAGNLICRNNSSTLFQTAGGFGGKPMPKSDVVIPERVPDIVVNDLIGPVQNVLYRLTGDTNLVHVDPEVAQGRGFDRPFMHGLCSFGYACRMAISALIPNEPERMTRIAAQMRSIVFPGTDITLRIWQEGEKRALFRLVNEETQKPILDRGVFEWK